LNVDLSWTEGRDSIGGGSLYRQLDLCTWAVTWRTASTRRKA
jgi:hypothetical protein